DTLADDFLASDALLFLTSCLLSYAALRARSLRRMHRIERAADVVFIVAIGDDDRYLRFHNLLDFNFLQRRTLMATKTAAQLVSFCFLKCLPGIPGTFPVLFCCPGLSLQQIEISWRFSVHGKMLDGSERVVDQPPIHLLAIEGVGGREIVRVAENSFPQLLD